MCMQISRNGFGLLCIANKVDIRDAELAQKLAKLCVRVHKTPA